MTNTSSKGNDPERWEKLLEGLDEKLQLGLLGKLNKVAAYHFEESVLFVQPGSKEDEEYLRKDAVFQQFQLLAQDLIKIEKVAIRDYQPATK